MNNYFKRFIHLSILSVFMMSEGCPPELVYAYTYPSPEEWPDECSFFTPFTVQYEIGFGVNEKDPPFTVGDPIPNAKVTCKVISVVRLPDPSGMDTCYQKTSLTNTFTGFTATDGFLTGYLTKEFNFTFGSTGDYFILEITVEKEGYYPEMKSNDRRYFYYDGQWIRHNSKVGPLQRKISYGNNFQLLAVNTNP